MRLREAFRNLALLGRYSAALARYNLILPWYDPGATKRFMSAVLEHDFRRGAGRKLETVSIHSVFPEISGQQWTTMGVCWGVEEPHLVGGLKAIGAKRVLEIGTFEGVTTLQLAANVPEDGHVYTINIDPTQVTHAALDVSDYDRRLAEKARERIGCRYRDTPQAERITQIIHDSATVDYTQYFDSVDMVYIDGGHSYAQARVDTEKARPLVRAGGAIFWHDYQPGCAGVTRYLHELAQTCPVKHIRSTQLAVLRL